MAQPDLTSPFETVREDENAALGSTVLLSEILSVLKRIDRNVEAQESKIGLLDAKVAAIGSNSNNNDTSDNRKTPTAAGNKVWSQEPIRKENLVSMGSVPKKRDLRLQMVNRGDSIDLRGARTSIASSQEARVLPGTLPWGSSVPRKLASGRNTPWGSVSRVVASSPKSTTISRTSTWRSIPAPPTAAESEIIEIPDDPAYSKFPPPKEWITTRFLGRPLEVKFDSGEARKLWTRYVGDSWTIPPDGRIEMTFQQHLLERLDKDKVTDLLQTLSDVSQRLEYQRLEDAAKRGSFRVTDFGLDPGNEESVWEYRAEVFTAKYKDYSASTRGKRPTTYNVQTAPWKRMIEVRGLSRFLIDGHETWTQNFRDPWTEALPLVSPVLPFFTDRERDSSIKKYTGMNAVNQALLFHQQCSWESPPNDDGLTFHITFYEVIDLACDDELDGDIWRSGRLHSEKELDTVFGVKSRRIRDSACTIVIVPDQGNDTYWTSIHMCPSNFDPYDKVPATIMKQNSRDLLSDLVDFTMGIVLDRWAGVANYFSGLIGHRDILSDPDAHDSLLFDDDTFSRSRKYFWAINFLTELDNRITWNISTLENFVHSNPADASFHNASPNQKPLKKRIKELDDLRLRLRRLKQEAIALRDGLFSASGVIESRASTRLGENVKLLTFVSIFFLPLSFCMSIWSVNDTTFSLKALLIAVILVGLGTYLIVFNLNNMVNFCNRVYDERKDKMIEQMKQDVDMRWKQQGDRFATFKPKQETLKPSDWVLGLFVLHRLTQWLRFRGVLRSRPEPVLSGEHAEVESVQEWRGFPGQEANERQESGDPPKIAKMQIKDKAETKRPLGRLNKMFRRDALASGNHV